MKRLSESLTRKTPSKNARKSPSRLGESGTPGRKTPGTPGRSGGGGDRFIPNRTAMDYERSHHLMLKQGLESGTDAMSPSKREYMRAMAENLGTQNLNTTRILAYQAKPPAAPSSHANNLKILYSSGKTPLSGTKKTVRHIPQAPERILDAPDILNDYYLNLVDWSSKNILAVALGAHIYLWHADSGQIQELACVDRGDGEEYVSSLEWTGDGCNLAVGTSRGEVELWDVECQRRSRVLRGGEGGRVASLAWNQWVLSQGCRSGALVHSDVRVAAHQVARLEQAHSQELCGLAWASDGRLLASGGNDNVLNVWPSVQGGCHGAPSPLYRLTAHQAAVKAVSWCPWQANTLASGGGTADRSIRLWNTSNGSITNTMDTKSQVCSLLWAPEYKELVSSHGYANNEITIWRWPSMTKVAELLGHTERVLNLKLSPDGSTLLSAGADETLRLWKCFTPDPARKKDALKGKSGAVSSLRMGIR